MWAHYDVCVRKVKENGWNLKHVSPRQENYREIVLQAAKQNVDSLRYAAEGMNGDREIMLEAVKNNAYYALEYASKELVGNRSFMLEAIQLDGLSLKHASDALKNDYEVVLTAIKKNSNALIWASAELQNDMDVVLQTVALDSMALELASPSLRSGGLENHLTNQLEYSYNVRKHIFVATVLFASKSLSRPPASHAAPNGESDVYAESERVRVRLCNNSDCILSLLRPSSRVPDCLSVQIKRLIWDYAGVRSGPQWSLIQSASRSIGLVADD